jgi:hypothetical protein
MGPQFRRWVRATEIDWELFHLELTSDTKKDMGENKDRTL